MKDFLYLLLGIVSISSTLQFQESPTITGLKPYTYAVGENITLQCQLPSYRSALIFLWNVTYVIDNKNYSEIIRHGTHDDGLTSWIEIEITDWMAAKDTYFICGTLDGAGTWSYSKFQLQMTRSPSLVYFRRLRPFTDTADIECAMEGSPDITLQLTNGGEQCLPLTFQRKDSMSILRWSPQRRSHIHKPIICIGSSYFTTAAYELSDSEMAIYGPKPHTYKRNTKISLICKPPNFPHMWNGKFKWYVSDRVNSWEEITAWDNDTLITTASKTMYFRCKYIEHHHQEKSVDFTVDPGCSPHNLVKGEPSIADDLEKVETYIAYGKPAPMLHMFTENGEELYPRPLTEYNSSTGVSKLIFNMSVYQRNVNYNYKFVAVNQYGIASLAVQKSKLGAYCQLSSDCATHLALCIGYRCRCDSERYAERRDNYRDECVPIRKLYENCEYTVQCEKTDPNAGCINGVCQCFPPYGFAVGQKCPKRVLLGQQCFRDEDCKAIPYARCFSIKGFIPRCTCMKGYIETHGICSSHRLFTDSNYLRVASITGLVSLCVIFAIVIVFLLFSLRAVYYKRKRNSYKEIILRNQNLSLSNKVPLDSPPPPELKKEAAMDTKEPHTPVELHVPSMKERSDSVSNADDPTIGFPETIPFIESKSNAVC